MKLTTRRMSYKLFSLLLCISSLLTACGSGTGSQSSEQSSIGSSVNVYFTLPTAVTVPHTGINTPIVITFSGPINPDSINSTSFIVGTAPQESNIGNGSTAVMSESNTVLTFTPESALPLNTRIFVSMPSSTVMDESGYYIEEAHNYTFITQPVNYLIYIATDNGNGWSGDLGGISGADAKCAADIQCVSGMTCKAMLADGINRDATSNNGIGTNWVLQASTQYQNGSNQIIGATVISPAVFAFPLGQAFGSLSNTLNLAWTGMQSDWSTNLTAICSGWSSMVDSGVSGITTAVTADSIAATPFSLCSNHNVLYCVQQP